MCSQNQGKTHRTSGKPQWMDLPSKPCSQQAFRFCKSVHTTSVIDRYNTVCRTVWHILECSLCTQTVCDSVCIINEALHAMHEFVRKHYVVQLDLQRGVQNTEGMQQLPTAISTLQRLMS